MPENKEQLILEKDQQPSKGAISPSPVIDAQAGIGDLETMSLKTMPSNIGPTPPVTPRHLPAEYIKRVPARNQAKKVNAKDQASIRTVEEQCRRLCLSLFSRQQVLPLKSLGFTSSINGEGKSFLALVTARILAQDSIEPVTLIECNWEHPTLHEQFGIPAKPGLAEWLRGECSEQDVRYRVDDNLTIISAGAGAHNAARLLKQLQQRGLARIFNRPNELLIVDLPPVITSSYGSLAASLVDKVMVVVRSEAIPARMLAETCSQLKDATIAGIILNQENSRIPRWIRQLM